MRESLILFFLLNQTKSCVFFTLINSGFEVLIKLKITGFLYLKNAYSYVLLQNRQENDNLSNAEVSRNQNPTDINKYSKSGRRQFDDETNSLESVVLAIDSGVKQLISGQSQPDIIDNIAKSIVDFAKYSADPIYRSKGQEYNISKYIQA